MILMMLIMALPVIGLLVFFLWPLRIALPVYVLMAGVAGFYHWVMMKTMRLPVQSGARKMLGSTARVLSWDDDSGQVTCCGEIWRARSEGRTPMRAGDSVVVVAVDRLTLVVHPEVRQ